MTPAERLEEKGREVAVLRYLEQRAMAELRILICEAVDGGMSEVEAANVAGVTRMTVRKALGK